MATNSGHDLGPGSGSGSGSGGGGTDKQAAAVINRLKKELEDSNRKLQETSTNLGTLTAQQKRTASSLEQELKRSQTLRQELDSKEARIQELLRQVEEYKTLIQQSTGNHSELLRVAKVKTQIENSALLLGTLSVPVGLILSTQSGGAGPGSAVGLVASSAGAATLLTAAAMKVAGRIGADAKYRGGSS